MKILNDFHLSKQLLSLFVFSTLLLCITCKEDLYTINELDCITIADTTGLNLYRFNQFPSDQWREMSYSEKIIQRQIPQDFLKKMNNKALFLQFVNCDLSGDVFMYNSIQAGFRHSIENLNMLQELLDRNEVESFFIENIEALDLSKIISNDCHFYYLCLQMLSVQPEVINKMQESNRTKFILSLLKQKNEIEQLAVINPDWQIPVSLTSVFTGFMNIMIEYNYSPFINLIETDERVRGFFNGAMLSTQVALLIDEQFKNFVSD